MVGCDTKCGIRWFHLSCLQMEEENGCVQCAIQPREQREENYSYHTKTLSSVEHGTRALTVLG